MAYSRLRAWRDEVNEWLRQLFDVPRSPDCPCGWTYHGDHRSAPRAIDRHRRRCPHSKDHD